MELGERARVCLCACICVGVCACAALARTGYALDCTVPRRGFCALAQLLPVLLAA